MDGIISRANTDLSAYSRVVQRLRRRYAQELSLLSAGAPTPAHLQACFSQLANTHAPAVALRILRQLVFERLVVMDCCEQADLSVITHAMTDLAEFSLDIAFSEAQRQLAERHGTPQLVGDEQALLWIVGMGKLGARELNVSSDIDLIYVYDEDGQFAQRCNTAMVSMDKVLTAAEQEAQLERKFWHNDQTDEAQLKKLLEDHFKWTGSRRARELLDDWANARAKFVKVFPTEYKRALGEINARKAAQPVAA